MQIVQESANTAIDPRWIELRVSRINIALNTAGVLIAICTMASLPLPQWLQIATALIFLAALAWDLRLVMLKSGEAVGAFYVCDLDSSAHLNVPQSQAAKLGIRIRYALIGQGGVREAEGTILSGAFVSPWFTAVRYAMPGDPWWRKWWPRIIPIWPDSIAADQFRRLRVALKWK